jgi:hypothetical protein
MCKQFSLELDEFGFTEEELPATAPLDAGLLLLDVGLLPLDAGLLPLDAGCAFSDEVGLPFSEEVG